MNKATAISPANIAFIKYWGKKDSKLNIPFNDSLSMNLSECATTSMVMFDENLKDDSVEVNGKIMDGGKKQRVVDILNVVRKMAVVKMRARVKSENNFPTAAGIASSASAFSALALAASYAAGLKLSNKEISIIARLGSGSACRSVVDGFGYWKRGKDNRTSYAVSLAPIEYWQLRDIVAVVSKESKKASSTEGHEATTTSPYFKTRLAILPKRIRLIKKAFLVRDFSTFGQLLEEEAVDLHVMAMTSKPPIFYWNKGTVEVMRSLRAWREEGLEAYYTIDAGANVHVICLTKDEMEVNKRLKKLPSVEFTIVNRPARGTRLV